MPLSLKANWYHAAYCDGSKLVKEAVIRSAGGARVTNANYGVGDATNDILPGSANRNIIDAVVPTEILTFPRTTLEAWWPGSGWWTGYPCDPTVDFSKIDQIVASIPDGTILLSDDELCTAMPLPIGDLPQYPSIQKDDKNSNTLTWAQTAYCEQRAGIQAGIRQSAYAYFRAVASAMGKPNIQWLEYISFPFQSIIASVYRYQMLYKGLADYPAIGPGFPYGGYGALYDRIRRAFEWSLARGYYARRNDGWAISQYAFYDDAEAATLYANGTRIGAIEQMMAMDTRLVVRLPGKKYAALSEAYNNPTIKNIDPTLARAFVDQAAAAYDGIILWSGNRVIGGVNTWIPFNDATLGLAPLFQAGNGFATIATKG